MPSIAYDYACVKQAGFLGAPNQHARYGYVTSLGGLGLGASLSRDLKVFPTFNPGTAPKFTGLQLQGGSANVVGVMDRFTWAGGARDPIRLDFWVSRASAAQLKTSQQGALKTSMVSALTWWIADYDQAANRWFEQAYPIGKPVAGILTGQGSPGVNVDLSGVPAKDGIDVMVYKIAMAVVPGANTPFLLQFADNFGGMTVKSWGLTVGSWATAAYA